MTLLFDGERAFFEERTARAAEGLSLSLPADSSLLCNGVRLSPASDSLHIPRAALYPGENTLTLKKDEHLYPCEGLIYDGETVTPCGMPTEAIIATQCKKIASLASKVDALSARLAVCESKLSAGLLFS